MKLTLFSLLISSSIGFCANFDQFAAALAKVESNNNPKAVNKGENALGAYQIRPAYFRDAAEFDRELAKYTHRDCFDSRVGKRAMWAYFRRYEPEALKNGNWEILARLHNSGPGWAGKKSKTNNYWAKIANNLD